MRKVAGIFCAGLAVGASDIANAADLPVMPTKAPAAVVTRNWTGFYVGGGFGYGFMTADTTQIATATNVALTKPLRNGGRGWLGIVTAGYDHQFNRIVAGVFGDYDFASIKGLHDTGGGTDFFDPLGGQAKMTSAWAVGGRLGWLLTPDVLTYVNGGYTRMHMNALAADDVGRIPATTGIVFGSRTYSGWFVGTGMETPVTMLGNGWFVRSEYRYARYGSHDLTQVSGPTFVPGATAAFLRVEPTVHTVRTELTYKFNPFGPTQGPPATVYGPKVPVKWTGFYVGGGGGYGFMTADTTSLIGTTAQTQEIRNGARGWLGTVTAGYDVQVSQVVAGVFGDYDWSSIKGEFSTGGSTSGNNPFGGEGKMTSAWYAGGRVGWLTTPEVLTYVNGGYTRMHMNAIPIESQSVTPGAPTGITAASHNYSGYFMGGGVEAPLTMIGPGWFVRSEYRRATYKGADLAATAPFVLGANALRVHPMVQTVRGEVTYKFNWP